MLETISSINSTVNGIVWGVPAMVLIFGVGLYLSIRTGFLQFRKFGTVWQNTIGKLFHRSTEAGRGADAIRSATKTACCGFRLRNTWTKRAVGAFSSTITRIGRYYGLCDCI